MYIKLKEVRQKYNISIEELSEISGISYAEILYIEKGLINPMVSTVIILARALNIDIDDQIVLGNYIYKIRREKGLSLRKLEKLAGVSKSQISNIERGRKMSSIIVMCKLLKALDIEVNNELFSNNLL